MSTEKVYCRVLEYSSGSMEEKKKKKAPALKHCSPTLTLLNHPFCETWVTKIIEIMPIESLLDCYYWRVDF